MVGDRARMAQAGCASCASSRSFNARCTASTPVHVPDGIALTAVIADDVALGSGTVVADNAVVLQGTILGEDCYIEPGAVLGKRPRLRPGSSAAVGDLGPLVIGAGVTICAGAVVYAGATVGDGAIVGDQTQVRERASIGPGSVVGRGSTVDFEAMVGARVLIQTGVYLTGRAIVEDDVFLGPGVTTTNDNTMGRHLPGEGLSAPVFRRACRVGGGVVLVPGIEIGEEAYVAAGAVVTKHVPPRAVAMGVPARIVREVPDEDLIERWR
jgi:acetyltransferase-like isoleucine patch superfamily enzyme